jgi:hypothetical protein
LALPMILPKRRSRPHCDLSTIRAKQYACSRALPQFSKLACGATYAWQPHGNFAEMEVSSARIRGVM